MVVVCSVQALVKAGTFALRSLEQVEIEAIKLTLAHLSWHISAAAIALDIDRRTLYRKIERYRLMRPSNLTPEREEEAAQ
jgi:transcriptional regulator of acetoin/glycerol metabolism